MNVSSSLSRKDYISPKHVSDMVLITNPDEIKQIARKAAVVAVIGISKKTERSSYQIANQIRNHYKIYYVNPVYANQEVFGKTILFSLKEISDHIDIVDVFRNPHYVGPIIEEAIEVGANVVWLQPGTESQEIIDMYKQSIDIIAHACLGVIARCSS